MSRGVKKNVKRSEPFTGSKVQRFKGCILITIRPFVNVLYGKTDRFHIPTNLPAMPTSWGMPVLYMTGEAGGSGTWYLVIIWQNQHFLRGLRVFNFVPVPNPAAPNPER